MVGVHAGANNTLPEADHSLARKAALGEWSAGELMSDRGAIGRHKRLGAK